MAMGPGSGNRLAAASGGGWAWQSREASGTRLGHVPRCRLWGQVRQVGTARGLHKAQCGNARSLQQPLAGERYGPLMV